LSIRRTVHHQSELTKSIARSFVIGSFTASIEVDILGRHVVASDPGKYARSPAKTDMCFDD
jgi:hypothetical protein